MKTKTLLMVAGAGALVYWLWKNNKAKPARENANPAGENADPVGENADSYDPEKIEAAKEKCKSIGGDWIQPFCFQAPCNGFCTKW